MPQGLVDGPESVLTRFSRAVDQRRPDAIAAVFTEDGLFRPGAPEMRGRATILSFYQARLSNPRRITRHLWNNVECRISGEGEARIEAILTNYAFEPATSETHLRMQVGDLKALCRLQDGEWLFAEHLYTKAYVMSVPLAETPVALDEVNQ
jgi:uncharacterized protein (TIGR02246 family)